ncbi:MAG: Gldg family protein [Anaerolineae bacterium]
MSKFSLNSLRNLLRGAGRDKRAATVQQKMALISTSITVIIVACLVLLNAAAVIATNKYSLKIDLTREKLFQVSDVTINYLKTLQQDVNIYVLADEATFASGNGQYYSQAYQVIIKYQSYSAKLHLEFVDLAVNPTFVSKYPNLTLAEGNILVTSGDATQVLTASDLFDIQFSYATYSNAITASNAEQALTSAILNVTTTNKPLVAIVKGHEEYDTASFVSILEKNGFKTQQVSLLTEQVPTDTAIILLAAPATDLSKDETAKLQAFLENNGAYGRYFIYLASIYQGALPNLETWLTQWGITVQPGAVVETNTNRVMSNNAYYGLADLVDTTLTGKMKSTEVPLILPLTRPLKLAFSSSMGYVTSPLLQYSATAGIASQDAASLADITISGPIVVGAESMYNGSGVIVYGSEYLIDGSLLTSSSVNNESYILSVFNTLSPRQNAVSIPSKTVGGGTFMIAQSTMMLYAGLFIIILPLGILVTGFVIWFRRRRM